MSYPVDECARMALPNCTDGNVKPQESPEDMAETIRRLRYDLRKAERRAFFAEESLNRILRTVKDAAK